MIHHSPRFPPPWSVEVVARKEAPLPGLMKVRLHVAQISRCQFRRLRYRLFGAKLSHPSDLWAVIEKSDTRFGFTRDVANTSKHVSIHRPSTSMSHIANTFIETGSFQSPGFQRSAFDTARVKMKDGSGDVEFDECARALFEYWTDLFSQIGMIV
jgi:hypothetical protein